MATAGGQSGPSLIGSVVGQYARFDVHQLVRLLRHRADGQWPVGARLRFRADLGAAFPGHEITRLVKAKPLSGFRLEGRNAAQMPMRIELRTPNYCVASELGPMPEPFLEWVREQERSGGKAMAEFFDIFNQRLHVLRHDLKHRSLRSLDPALPERSHHAERLAALMGLSLPSQRAQVPLPERAWLGLAGMLINTRRSGAVVERVLSSYLGVPCKLKMLVGRDRDIEPRDRLLLGGSQHRLGRSTLLGRTTWDPRAAVRLDIGKLSFGVCCALMPLRPARRRESLPEQAHLGLVAMIRLLLDRRFDCEVRIEVDPDTVPPAYLQLPWRGGGLGLRLGQTAWLGRRAGRHVRFDVPAFEAEGRA